VIKAFRSLRLKAFLTLIGIIATLYFVIFCLFTYIEKTELTNIYIEKIAKVNNRWNDEVVFEKTENQLKKEILLALEISDEKNVQIFLMPFDEQSSTQGDQIFLPRTKTANFIEQMPLTSNFPLLATAMIEFQGQRWLTTRMIAPKGVILTMVNTRVINQRM
jgi:hypothetical protein